MLDCIIIGAGISGMVSARTMIEAGMKIAVIDDSWRSSASRVAAGLVNPITGKRFQVSWRYNDFLSFAKSTYSRYSKLDAEEAYLKPFPMLRLFADEQEARTFRVKIPTLFPEQYIGEQFSSNSNVLHPSLRNEFGGYRTLETYTFDYNRILHVSASLLGETLIPFHVKSGHISNHKGIWKIQTNKSELLSKRIVFCDGWVASRNQWLADLKLQFDIVKGELCIIRSSELPETDIISRGFAIIPIGNKHFRCAATFQWNDYTMIPTSFGYERLNQRIRSLIQCDYEILEHSAGLRPTMLHHKPFIGEHPKHTCLYAIGGLGTKGALYAPFMAQELVNHIANGRTFDEEMDLALHCQHLEIT